MVDLIPSSVRSYLRSFDLAAVALTRENRLISTRDPSGCEACWWCAAGDIGRLIKAARKDRDVLAAARALGIVVTEHSVVMARVRGSIERIDTTLVKAQSAGSLKFFNLQYQRRRLAAQAEGKGFISYTVAKQRLRKAIAEVAAGDTGPLLTRVFERSDVG
jgi:hypothetical protein